MRNRASRYTKSLIASAVILTAAGCAHNTTTLKTPAPLVPIEKTAVRTVQPVLSLSGLVAPLQNVAITSDLTEPAAAVLVNEGDVVQRSQVLARLSIADLQAQLDAADRAAAEADAKATQTKYQAQYAIASGGDQVRSAQAQLDLAESTLHRDQMLFGQGYISAQEVQTQQTNVAAAQAVLATAKENQLANGDQRQGMQQANIQAAIAAAASAHAQAEQVQAQIAKATIVAPVDGVVVNRNINPGEYPGTRQIFTLQEISSVYAALNAFGGQIAGIPKGATVTLTSVALPGQRFNATVVAVLPPTSPTSAGFIVKVVIPNPKRALLPGMTVAANVAKQSLSGVTVPVGAFIDDTHHTLFTVDNNDTAHISQVVEIARGTRYAVVKGLPSGVNVVTDGTLAISDGQQVQIAGGEAAMSH
ncbi:MAG TPA: efflux RND transporter periplasmic adaptor subunit [Candidatus Eremiobacteraceae bacterium]|nr:efflux RND transporter periplasmic adaptor subunit [Candidatus Eremiobacteraceae bacterium]